MKTLFFIWLVFVTLLLTSIAFAGPKDQGSCDIHITKSDDKKVELYYPAMTRCECFKTAKQEGLKDDANKIDVVFLKDEKL